MTVWIYVDMNKQVVDQDHLKVFASEDAAEHWFRDNDPEGVSIEGQLGIGHWRWCYDHRTESVRPIHD
jgi:hypothetical protein